METKNSGPAPGTLYFGRVSGVFGLRGEVRLHLENRASTALHRGAEVWLRAPGGRTWRAQVRTRPGAGGRVLAQIEGISDRTQAEALRGTELWIPREVLPPLGPDEFYHADLIGMEVRCGGTNLGRVQAIHAYGPVEIVELDGARYLPVTRDRIVSIDLEARVIEVREGAVAV